MDTSMYGSSRSLVKEAGKHTQFPFKEFPNLIYVNLQTEHVCQLERGTTVATF